MKIHGLAIRGLAIRRRQAGQVIQLQVPTHREVNLGVFLPDPVRMLTATEAEPVRLWDLAGTLRVRDQRLVLSAAHDRTVRVWDVDTGACRRVFAGHAAGAINAVWLSADRIASCAWNGEVRTWSMAG